MLFADTVRATTAMLAKNRLFMKLLRWDVTPEVLFRPRLVDSQKNANLRTETDGYMFYIDWYKGKGTPALMIMKTMGMSSNTFAEVTDCPRELLDKAVRREGVKSYSDMYPIDEDIEAWLKKKLETTSRT